MPSTARHSAQLPFMLALLMLGCALGDSTDAGEASGVDGSREGVGGDAWGAAAAELELRGIEIGVAHEVEDRRLEREHLPC